MAYYRASGDAPDETPERVGVLIVNLGTPDAPRYGAVLRYLREFLSDRRVIETTPLLWLPLLYGIVLPLRSIRTAANYRKIWLPEGSPLLVYSRRLVEKIAASLTRQFGDQIRVSLAMTYGRPALAEAIWQLARANVTRLVVLPLYPHHCASTTGSVFDRLTRALRRVRRVPELRFIGDYHQDPGFITSLASQIETHWNEQGARSHLLFSYHGIPAAYVARGDPYQRQAEQTTRLVAQALKLKDGDYSHCYQSRFGRVEWLKPYTQDTVVRLARAGVEELTVVSPSFAVDCLETLEEVAIEYRQLFLDHGGRQLTLVPGLNDGKAHVAALTRLIEAQLQDW
jgi:ferrochelatase